MAVAGSPQGHLAASLTQLVWCVRGAGAGDGQHTAHWRMVAAEGQVGGDELGVTSSLSKGMPEQGTEQSIVWQGAMQMRACMRRHAATQSAHLMLCNAPGGGVVSGTARLMDQGPFMCRPLSAWAQPDRQNCTLRLPPPRNAFLGWPRLLRYHEIPVKVSAAVCHTACVQACTGAGSATGLVTRSACDSSTESPNYCMRACWRPVKHATASFRSAGRWQAAAGKGQVPEKPVQQRLACPCYTAAECGSPSCVARSWLS